MNNLEQYFHPFRINTIGREQTFISPFGEQRIVYADWTASGRLYRPIEELLMNTFGPFVGNTHSESTVTGTTMTRAYHEAHQLIKNHVHAGPDDLIITCGSGMTGAINKFQRILGLKAPQGLRNFIHLGEAERPVVFVSHMEHHSNHTSWYETIADVVILPPDQNGQVDLAAAEQLFKQYENRPAKFGAFITCSNVTGVFTPIHDLARLIHRHGGIVIADYAASAPYTPIDMHPPGVDEHLDAVLFSPHKFLGGPGSSGVLVFNKSLYKNSSPDDVGGGTVAWTNPWGGYRFLDDIEAREDAGTPGFLQAIKASLAVRLKETMGVEAMKRREDEIVSVAFRELRSIPGLYVLANNIERRLAMFSFHVEDLHYNLLVKLLNDRFGVQARGGCSCAGTYGHYLLHVDPFRSKAVTDKINQGDLTDKPGWVRLSFHPTMTNDDVLFCVNAVREIVQNKTAWAKDYTYSPKTNEYSHFSGNGRELNLVKQWFGAEG
jgi:selenocysteine lyase/cysteine desulfurase